MVVLAALRERIGLASWACLQISRRGRARRHGRDCSFEGPGRPGIKFASADLRARAVQASCSCFTNLRARAGQASCSWTQSWPGNMAVVADLRAGGTSCHACGHSADLRTRAGQASVCRYKCPRGPGVMLVFANLRAGKGQASCSCLQM